MNPFYLYEAFGGRLADLADRAGVSASYLRDLKACTKRIPALDTAVRISNASDGLVPVGLWAKRRSGAERRAA